jgi:hypothetical protein
MSLLTMPLSGVLTRLRMLEPDAPMWCHPEHGGRTCEFITSSFAETYVNWGVDRMEYHANWGV